MGSEVRILSLRPITRITHCFYRNFQSATRIGLTIGLSLHALGPLLGLAARKIVKSTFVFRVAVLRPVDDARELLDRIDRRRQARA